MARELTELKGSNSQLVSYIEDLKESRCAPKKMLSNSKTGPYPQVAGLARRLDFQGYGVDMRRGRLLTQRMGHSKLE